MGQSRISTHLAQLKQAGLVEDRRNGKSILYRLKPQKSYSSMITSLRGAVAEIPGAANDHEALRLALRRRQDTMRAHFDAMARKFGKHYVPGRSWKGIAEALFSILPPMTIADLGAGDGDLSQMLARRAKRVIAIDNSEKMVEYGSARAESQGIKNLEFRKGDIEDVPIRDGSVDLAFFSQALHHAQHPERAVAEAYRIVKPGGRIVVLDLMRHSYEEAREMYADLWLGFTEVDVARYLMQAGFKEVETSVVHRESEAPHFETMLAVGHK